MDVFELKLQIQQLQEKVAYLGGGTTGEQLVECIQERDEALARKDWQLEENEKELFHLADVLANLDAKRKEAQRKCLAHEERIVALEKSLADECARSEGLATDVERGLRTVAERDDRVAALEADAAAAKREEQRLREVAEGLRADIAASELKVADLQRQLSARHDEVLVLEERRRDTAARARSLKQSMEVALHAEQEKAAAAEGRLSAAEAEVAALRERCQREVSAAADASGRAAAAEQENDGLRRRLAAAAAERNGLAASLAEAEAKLTDTDARASALAKEKETLFARVRALDDELGTARAAASEEAASAKKQLQEQRDIHEQRMRDVAAQIKSHENTSEAMVSVLEAQVGRLAKQLEAASNEASELNQALADSRKRVTERERRIEVLQKTEQRWAERVESELGEVRQELQRCRRQAAQSAVLSQENAELKARIQRQEAFVKRRLEQEKRTPLTGGGSAAGHGATSLAASLARSGSSNGDAPSARAVVADDKENTRAAAARVVDAAARPATEGTRKAAVKTAALGSTKRPLGANRGTVKGR